MMWSPRWVRLPLLWFVSVLMASAAVAIILSVPAVAGANAETGRTTGPGSQSCPDTGPGETVVLREGTCVISWTKTTDGVADCSNRSGDPNPWTLNGVQCIRVVNEEYQVQTTRRVAPFSERVRVAPFSKRVRVAPFSERVRVAPFSKRVRVVPFSERVRVAPFSERVRVAPFSKRVRVAPFSKLIYQPVPYTYNVEIRDRCVRWNYQNGECTGWRYRTEIRKGFKVGPVRVPLYNYETRDLYKYETRQVYNYETREVYNYGSKDVHNYGSKDVYNYETQEVYNYDTREVYNYEKIYDTRTRPVTKIKPHILVCPDGFARDGQRCSRQMIRRVTPIPLMSAPSAPEGRAVIVGDGKVTLKWASNGKDTTSEYQCWYRPVGYREAWIRSVVTSSLSCTITGLANGTAYHFAVRASNQAGTSSSFTWPHVALPLPKPNMVIEVQESISTSSSSTTTDGSCRIWSDVDARIVFEPLHHMQADITYQFECNGIWEMLDEPIEANFFGPVLCLHDLSDLDLDKTMWVSKSYCTVFVAKNVGFYQSAVDDIAANLKKMLNDANVVVDTKWVDFSQIADYTTSVSFEVEYVSTSIVASRGGVESWQRQIYGTALAIGSNSGFFPIVAWGKEGSPYIIDNVITVRPK